MWTRCLDGVPVPRGSDAACLSDVPGAVFMACLPLCACKHLSGPKNADLLEEFRYCELAFEEQGRKSRALT